MLFSAHLHSQKNKLAHWHHLWINNYFFRHQTAGCTFTSIKIDDALQQDSKFINKTSTSKCNVPSHMSHDLDPPTHMWHDIYPPTDCKISHIYMWYEIGHTYTSEMTYLLHVRTTNYFVAYLATWPIVPINLWPWSKP